MNGRNCCSQCGGCRNRRPIFQIKEQIIFLIEGLPVFFYLEEIGVVLVHTSITQPFKSLTFETLKTLFFLKKKFSLCSNVALN